MQTQPYGASVFKVGQHGSGHFLLLVNDQWKGDPVLGLPTPVLAPHLLCYSQLKEGGKVFHFCRLNFGEKVYMWVAAGAGGDVKVLLVS